MKGDTRKLKKLLVKNIKKYRAKKKLTQEEATEKADITAKYWQRLEMASQTDLPSLVALGKIAAALKVKLHQLLQ